ncbi:MAG: phage holin [Lachnospiraceae bacterium]|nr:phage holin [Lachnospiraceae bacterium]
MSKINLKGITSEAVTNMLILLIALVNTTLQMFHISVLPIADEDVTNIISTIFLIVTTLWNTWKNRNFTSASQIAQNITNAIKNGELLEQDVKKLIGKTNDKG